MSGPVRAGSSPDSVALAFAMAGGIRRRAPQCVAREGSKFLTNECLRRHKSLRAGLTIWLGIHLVTGPEVHPRRGNGTRPGQEEALEMARRPRRWREDQVPDDLIAVAEQCEYVGSSEHKDQRFWLGLPRPRRRPRNVATICPMVTTRERDIATGWVRTAISAGQFDRTDWRNGFPRRVWYRDDNGQIWYGFLTNQGAGPSSAAQYKGWPIDEDEWREIFSGVA